MTFSRRIHLMLALTGACATAAMADSFSFEGPQYVVGGGLNGVVAENGNTWQLESATETREFIVDNTVFSPTANPLVGGVSTKSLRFDINGTFGRFGMDLASPVLTGIVTLQWDVRNDLRQAGNTVCNFNIFNTSQPAGGPHPVDPSSVFVWRMYVQNGGGGAAAQNAFVGLPGRGERDGIGIFGDCRDQAPAFPDLYCNNAFWPQLIRESAGANDRWYRVKMWLNLSDTTNPGRLIYAALYDVSCGSEIQIGEHHIVNQITPIKKYNNAGAAEVRAFQLRVTGGDGANAFPIDHRVWVDNVVIAADPGFTPPSPIAAPPVPSATLNADAGAQEVTTAYTLPNNAGDTVSMARSGSTFYASDSTNGLTSWSGGPSATMVDDMAEVQFDSNGTGVLVADTAGTLYLVANEITINNGWRDLLRYNTGPQTWTIVADGDAGGQTGNHSASLLTFSGVGHVVHAWTGAKEYPSLNMDGTKGPTLSTVGNRWAGATTEGFADGASGNQLYYLQQTDASGNPINTHIQAYNGIYRAVYGSLGCDLGNTPLTRVSPSARLLPWVTNAPDGGNVNRHNMEFEPARNRIWVLRAGNSNEIGIYDIAQDRFGVLKVNRPGGAALTMDKADLQLSADGSQMYILARGEGAVYAVSTNIVFVNTGACITGANCALLTAAACATAGGTYLGDNQVCPPPGACCNGTTCTIAYQVTCAAGGGAFQGAGTVCADYTVGAGGAFEDIEMTGTAVPGIDDDNSVVIPIGFSFTHYGNTYTDVRVGANGYLSFSGGDGADSWVPRIGNPLEPNNLVAGLWTDLSPQIAPGSLKYQVLGASPNRRLVVQWTRVSQFTTGAPIDENTFQIVLFESTNNAEVRFGVLNNPSTTPLPANQTGIENADGSQSELGTVAANTAQSYAPTPNPCSCPADFNNSGSVTVQDIFDFLAAYFSNNPSADINNSGGVTVQDIFDFLALYFAGC